MNPDPVGDDRSDEFINDKSKGVGAAIRAF